MNDQKCIQNLGQLDPWARNLAALQAISRKLLEVNRALKGCEKVTERLSQAVDVIAKSMAADHTQEITRRIDG